MSVVSSLKHITSNTKSTQRTHHYFNKQVHTYILISEETSFFQQCAMCHGSLLPVDDIWRGKSFIVIEFLVITYPYKFPDRKMNYRLG